MRLPRSRIEKAVVFQQLSVPRQEPDWCRFSKRLVKSLKHFGEQVWQPGDSPRAAVGLSIGTTLRVSRGIVR